MAYSIDLDKDVSASGKASEIVQRGFGKDVIPASSRDENGLIVSSCGLNRFRVLVAIE